MTEKRTDLAAELDDVDAFYLRLARALRAKFDAAPYGVTASDIWQIVADVGDAPIRAEGQLQETPAAPSDYVAVPLPILRSIADSSTDPNARGFAQGALSGALTMATHAHFQARVAEWMDKCFVPSLYSDMTERGDRLLEEVLELLQAHGYDRARVPTLVKYVYSRPVGKPAQEVGGVMVTLAGFCWIGGQDMHAAGEAELARICQPEVMAMIRAKQEAKNALHFDTPLPGNAGGIST